MVIFSPINRMIRRIKHPKWTMFEQIRFFQFIYHYVNEGVSLFDTLTLIQPIFPKRHQQDILFMKERLANGVSLLEIFTALCFDSEVLSVFTIQMDGEKSGNLFQKCYLILDQKWQYLKFIRTLLTYPIFLLILVVFSGVFMSEMLLPQYEQYMGSGNMGRFSTYWLMNGLFVTIPKCTLFFLFVAAVYAMASKLIYKDQFIIHLIKLQINLPQIGPLIKKMNSFVFSQLLLIILKSNISLIDGLHLLIQSNSPFTKYQGEWMKRGLENGMNLSLTVQNMGIYERHFENVLSHGHIHGNLLNELESYTEIIKSDLKLAIARGLKSFQFFIFFIVFLYVVCLYSAILLPMFEIYHTF